MWRRRCCLMPWAAFVTLQTKKAKLTEVEEAVVHGVPDAAAEAVDANGTGEKKIKKKKRVRQFRLGL